MRCPVCDGRKTDVVEHRDTSGNAIRRRRACRTCGTKFTTYEASAAGMLGAKAKPILVAMARLDEASRTLKELLTANQGEDT